ncbi:MAG: class III poly(R)-hydroxyalkanoic acid synthase subunit PhaC [Gammaproteobacteria bacterium]|nr:MAG: class III poly(R)-hydroxyalkanoic acid synthase subunit PhaC [Gammaproteobacteria bacterium]
MERYRFNPSDILTELNELNRKFTDASATLMQENTCQVAPHTKEEVLSNNIFKLYRYEPAGEKRALTPILITYASINRPYILDLQEDRSFIKPLLENGFEVYLIDWGYPKQKDKFLSLDDYINGFINNCIKHIQRETCLQKVNLLGVCQGGVLNLCYAAINPQNISNLVCINTPVDFHTQNDRVYNHSKHIDFDKLVEAHGLIPGKVLSLNFINTNPMHFISRKYSDFALNIDHNERKKLFLRIEKWNFDCPDQPGTAFGQFCNDFYKNNKLISSEIIIGSNKVDLKNIVAPVLNIYSTEDIIVPPESSKALKGLTNSLNYHEIACQGGHISPFISKKCLSTIPSRLCDWLMLRDSF